MFGLNVALDQNFDSDCLISLWFMKFGLHLIWCRTLFVTAFVSHILTKDADRTAVEITVNSLNRYCDRKGKDLYFPLMLAVG